MIASGNSHADCYTLTVASSSVADLQIGQVVQEMLEIKGWEGRFKSLFLFMQPGKKKSERCEAFTQTQMHNKTGNFLQTQTTQVKPTVWMWLIY